jgi:hypothetical protein
MKFTLAKSPKKDKKFRVTLENGTKVDFGARGYTDYTKHKNPMRMRSYVKRHGGRIPKKIMAETDPARVHRAMLKVRTSDKENWSDPTTAGFWSRWLLWSFPTLNQARKYITSEL